MRVRTSAILRGPEAVECAGSGDHVARVVVLRAAVSTMGFERIRLRVIVSDRYFYAKPKPNSLGCSRTRGLCSCGGGGGGTCVHDYLSLSS